MASKATLTGTAPCCCCSSPFKQPKPIEFSLPNTTFALSKFNYALSISQSYSNYRFASNNFTHIKKPRPSSSLVCNSLSTVSSSTAKYEFSDGRSEVELRFELGSESIVSSKDVFVDADENSLLVRVKQAGSLRTAMKIDYLYDRIKPAETIWLLDEDQLVINLKKQDSELKWPDIMESWESLSVGVLQLLKGTSIYVVGDSTEINQKVSRELAVGLGYTQLDTTELLEAFTKQTIDSLVIAEGSNAVAETESAILESLSSHIRSVVLHSEGRMVLLLDLINGSIFIQDLLSGSHNLKLQVKRVCTYGWVVGATGQTSNLLDGTQQAELSLLPHFSRYKAQTSSLQKTDSIRLIITESHS